MLDAEFFRGTGLFVSKEFVDGEWCAGLCSEMAAAAATPATVQQRPGTYAVDESVRRVRQVDVEQGRQAALEAKLETLRPEIAAHYDIELSGFQPVQFLRYVEGDYYKVHRDRSADAEATETSRQRRISAVMFFNDQLEKPAEGGFGGGALTFYGLLPDPRLADRGFSLAIEAGLLVTFPADTTHEVLPVTHGVRYTAATWFF